MNFKGIVRGALLSLILVIIALFICAVLVYFNITTEKTASVIVFAVTMLSLFISSFGVVRASDTKLLLNALCVALLFSVVIFITSLIVNQGIALHTRTLTLMGGTFASAFLGAVFGK